MYAMILVRYRAATEKVEQVTPEHRAYLRGLKDKGVVVASGPMNPRTGGMILVRVPDDNAAATLDQLRNNDPFFQQGIANYELVQWKLTMGQEDFDKI